MEPALKQRLIGAAVLLALAVIFLPMLIKGPAPESGVSGVSLEMPDSPDGEYETRELPLVGPGSAPSGGAVGMDASVGPGAKLPTVDTTPGDPAAEGEDAMMPPPTAGGNYAVSFGSYASAADAQRVVGALRASQLPGYQDSVAGSNGRTLYRVRVGPYASQAEAEAARLRAAHVRDDVGSRVVVLDAEPAAASTVAEQPAVAAPAVPPVAKPQPPAPSKPATPTAPVSRPAAPVAAPTPASKPAAADVGFAVQLGAFAIEAEADKLRDRARAAGFSAFVEQVRTDKGTLSRVRVGPVASRAEADRLKAQLATKLGIDGFVQSHP